MRRAEREFRYRAAMSAGAIGGGVLLILLHADASGYLMLGAGLYNLAPKMVSSVFTRPARRNRD